MFPAAFLALLAPQLRQPGAPAAALAGALIAVVLLPSRPRACPVLAASVGVLVALRVREDARMSWAALLALAAGRLRAEGGRAGGARRPAAVAAGSSACSR